MCVCVCVCLWGGRPFGRSISDRHKAMTSPPVGCELAVASGVPGPQSESEPGHMSSPRDPPASPALPPPHHSTQEMSFRGRLLSHTHTDTHTHAHILTHSHTHTFTLDPSHTCVAPEKSLKLSTTNYRAVSSASANAGGPSGKGVTCSMSTSLTTPHSPSWNDYIWTPRPVQSA